MDQTEEETIITLPKLIKEKIDDYNYQSYLETTNKNLDEMVKKVNLLLDELGGKCSRKHFYDVINGRKAKIDDYNYQSYIEITNKDADEIFKKIEVFLHDIGINFYCKHYDVIDGRKIYCLQKFYSIFDIYYCFTCKNENYYCGKHSIEKLSRVLKENDLFCGLFCEECICSKKYKEHIKYINPIPSARGYKLFKIHQDT
ncbi:MAG: hypothetical protein WD512_14915 [Candidatus Paceibacterota bacterium]